MTGTEGGPAMVQGRPLPSTDTDIQARENARRRRWRRGGVPATRDLEITFCGLVASSAAAIAVALLLDADSGSLAALVGALTALGAATALLAAWMAITPPSLRARGGRRWPVRAAVVGPVAATTAFAARLEQAGVGAVEVVGAVLPDGPPAPAHRSGELGALSDVGRIVEEHRIDVLLIAFGVSRPLVVDAVMRSCEGCAVRVCHLSAFYEDVFGHVPLTEIDSAWFECVLHPSFRPARSQRAFDIVAGGVLALMFLPVLAVLAPLIRRDGGPVFFAQLRIGQDGRPFRLYKLRTMRYADEGGSQRWAISDDPRVTSVGRLLRRTHLDELPQLFNVLRGEMALVGPRPEQPELAARLEESVPFWRGRYRHKPGVTGWAQIRCGYAGSDDGSAWKLAHDLYYLRHRSLILDAAILLQTASTLLFRKQFFENPFSPYVLHSAAQGTTELAAATVEARPE
jgi:exopolysaccharide biosynthesis polyprenyl glycosylphosphotransferase